MIVAYAGENIVLPDFLIVGAARSGTTLLHSQLSQHPDFFFPPEKEPKFLCTWGQAPYYIYQPTRTKASWIVYSLDEYAEMFRNAAADRIIGEASTWYLYAAETTIANIKRLYGDLAQKLKIVIILRNPADRAWSHFLCKKGEQTEPLEFEAAIQPDVVRRRIHERFSLSYDYLGFGRYFQQVSAYLEAFRSVKILIFEEMVQDIHRYLSQILDFLGARDISPDGPVSAVNVSGLPRSGWAGFSAKVIFQRNILKTLLKPFIPRRTRRRWKLKTKNLLFRPVPLDPALRQRLVDDYKPDIMRLENLLHKNLSFWYDPNSRGETSADLQRDLRK